MHLFTLLAAALLSSAAFGQVRAPGAAGANARPARVAAPPAKPAAAPAPVARPAAPEPFAVTVSGSITDAEGLPLPGATVWNPGTREILAVANAQGEFTLSLPTNAAVTLTCGYAGFGDQQIRLSQPHRNNDFVISLEPNAPKTR
ncbi:carboxypeptidase-like regulatory domain-containing protein [Hymenobacter jeollabukensis]|uniref:Carboxypeptidase-like regulatory domain-containing protein n=1 Tax=Hymenobacter jeollabukensis TaxID=2025313 RepID=A0A5R8WM79_9BACT|nr:carboxypeptidase-like regulatory domain-containing protein [Hymenobacter jeollabukensis]TLM90068.1 carboxypeptidase-like regulatory domain-containing protein [Hymenobacter jeollabukensis]